MLEVEIGNRIYTRRKALELTLQDVADRVHVARSTIQRYEAGTISQMKMPVLYSIAHALSVNPEWLIGKSDDMEIAETSQPKSFPCSVAGLDPQEADLVQTFRSLNPLGQEEALQYVRHLADRDIFKKESSATGSLPAAE